MSQTATGLDIEAVRKQFPAIGQNADFGERERPEEGVTREPSRPKVE